MQLDRSCLLDLFRRHANRTPQIEPSLGQRRDVRIIYRSRFADPRPFQREFEGIQCFEPIPRSHPSQVHILHVGKNDTPSVIGGEGSESALSDQRPGHEDSRVCSRQAYRAY